MLEGKKITAMLPNSWKTTFNNGVLIPTKLRFCTEFNDKKMCNNCNNQSIETKEFEANLKKLKRHASYDFGYMFSYYKE